MAIDPELRKKLQIFLVAAIVLAGGRAAYIVYDRYEERKEDERPKQEKALNADYYVTPRKLRPYDLKSARELTKQPVWVKVGYGNTYYPYDVARHKAEFGREAGTLGPLQKLQIQDVVRDVAPLAPGVKQILARFEIEGKAYVVPIGVENGGDYKIYSDDMFLVQDPHELYQHWSAEVWKAIDGHEVRPGMSELQVGFALGLGAAEGAGEYGSRTLHYANGGKPVRVTFRNDEAVEIVPGS
ncbi:MAG: hypothetical protein HYR57_04015 [Candidatus Koribacter versatilis]|nr:hypothetical protein [Candidatus Koribacter versatilis]